MAGLGGEGGSLVAHCGKVAARASYLASLMGSQHTPSQHTPDQHPPGQQTPSQHTGEGGRMQSAKAAEVDTADGRAPLHSRGSLFGAFVQAAGTHAHVMAEPTIAVAEPGAEGKAEAETEADVDATSPPPIGAWGSRAPPPPPGFVARPPSPIALPPALLTDGGEANDEAAAGSEGAPCGAHALDLELLRCTTCYDEAEADPSSEPQPTAKAAPTAEAPATAEAAVASTVEVGECAHPPSYLRRFHTEEPEPEAEAELEAALEAALDAELQAVLESELEDEENEGSGRAGGLLASPDAMAMAMEQAHAGRGMRAAATAAAAIHPPGFATAAPLSFEEDQKLMSAVLKLLEPSLLPTASPTALTAASMGTASTADGGDADAATAAGLHKCQQIWDVALEKKGAPAPTPALRKPPHPWGAIGPAAGSTGRMGLHGSPHGHLHGQHLHGQHLHGHAPSPPPPRACVPHPPPYARHMVPPPIHAGGFWPPIGGFASHLPPPPPPPPPHLHPRHLFPYDHVLPPPYHLLPPPPVMLANGLLVGHPPPLGHHLSPRMGHPASSPHFH